MLGLGEQVDWLDIVELVAGGDEVGEVANLGRGVAGDVDYAVGLEGEKLIEKELVAALAGRIDEHGGLDGGVVDLFENGFGAGGEEVGVGDVIGARILACPVGGSLADLDPRDFLEAVSEAQGEEAGAAIGINQVARAALGCFGARIVDEGLKDEGVILEEVASEEIELKIADFLRGDGLWIGLDATFGGPHEQSRAAFVVLNISPCLIAQFRQCAVDLLHGDWALRDVDDLLASADLEEADVSDLAALGLLEMRREFGAIVIFGRGGQGIVDRCLDLSHAQQQFGDLIALPFELFFVAEVLVLAAAALSEERAGGFEPIWRGLDDLD